MRELSSADLDRAQRWAASGVAVSAGLLCLWMLARLAWLALPHGDDAGLAPLPVAPTAAAAPAVSVSKWHLFGTSAAIAAAAQRAPATTLRLILHGTLAESDPSEGMAVIADETGVERAYRVGDSLPGGAALHQIYPDRVVLLHEGAEETLTLPVEQGNGQQQSVLPTGPSSPRGAAVAGGGNPGFNNPAVTPGAAVLFTPPQVNNQNVDWSKVQQQIAANPMDFARQVNALPVFENGRMSGVRLTVNDATLAAKLGLQPNDIVTSVNGIALDAPERLPQLLESLKSAAAINATVVRDGKPTTLSVNVK